MSDIRQELYTMQPVRELSVVERIIEQIQNALAYGRFKLGDKLPSEFELMEELHVGRNSLREAMRVLTTLGIVEVRRGDGTYFCNELKPSFANHVAYRLLLKEASAFEIIEFRQMLDEDILTLAVQKCTKDDITKLKEYIDEMRNAFNSGDISKAAKLDYSFHMFLAQCSRNKFLIRIFSEIYAIFESSIEQNMRNEELFASADKHHAEMVECIEFKNINGVSKVINNSLESWKENIIKEHK